MKKLFRLLVLVLIVVALIYVGRRLACGDQKTRTCDRIADLCSLDKETMAGFDKCDDMLVKLRKAAGEETVQQLHDCVGEAESCVAVLGCATGASLEATAEFMKGFMRGLQHQ